MPERVLMQLIFFTFLLLFYLSGHILSTGSSCLKKIVAIVLKIFYTILLESHSDKSKNEE